MLKAFSTPKYKRRTLVLLAIAFSLGAAAGALGLDDNPPGLLLAFLSAATCGVAFIHPWRSPRSFRRLAYWSVAGFLVSAFLHNAFYAMGLVPGLPPLMRGIFDGAGVLFFFSAILLFPPLFVVGLVGALVVARMKEHA